MIIFVNGEDISFLMQNIEKTKHFVKWQIIDE